MNFPQVWSVLPMTVTGQWLPCLYLNPGVFPSYFLPCPVGESNRLGGVWQPEQVNPPHPTSWFWLNKKGRQQKWLGVLVWFLSCDNMDSWIVTYNLRLCTLYNYNLHLRTTMVTISWANERHIKPHQIKIPVKSLSSTVVEVFEKNLLDKIRNRRKKPTFI